MEWKISWTSLPRIEKTGKTFIISLKKYFLRQISCKNNRYIINTEKWRHWSALPGKGRFAQVSPMVENIAGLVLVCRSPNHSKSCKIELSEKTCTIHVSASYSHAVIGDWKVWLKLCPAKDRHWENGVIGGYSQCGHVRPKSVVLKMSYEMQIIYLFDNISFRNIHSM